MGKFADDEAGNLLVEIGNADYSYVSLYFYEEHDRFCDPTWFVGE
jgi:hypothetical protein